jgi:hypothetical protein
MLTIISSTQTAIFPGQTQNAHTANSCHRQQTEQRQTLGQHVQEEDLALAMNAQWLQQLSIIVWYLLLPFRLLLSLLLYLLSWLLAPVLLLARIGWLILAWPLDFLAQFEVGINASVNFIWIDHSHYLIQTFYIFFGVAIAVGIVFGLGLHFSERFWVNLLGLNRATPPREKAAKGHSASSYRAAREKKRLDEELRKAAQSRLLVTESLLGSNSKGRDARRMQRSPLSPLSPSISRPRAGLLSTTILEEVDDSEEDYGF